MESHFEINVSQHGKHLFATADRSCNTREKMVRVYNAICNRFPGAEGFAVDVTYWRIGGEPLNPGDVMTIQKNLLKAGGG